MTRTVTVTLTATLTLPEDVTVHGNELRQGGHTFTPVLAFDHDVPPMSGALRDAGKFQFLTGTRVQTHPAQVSSGAPQALP